MGFFSAEAGLLFIGKRSREIKFLFAWLSYMSKL